MRLDGLRVPVDAAPDVGTVELDVEVAGPDDGPVVLLVAGLGMQRTDWPAELLAALHGDGYRTVAADNRDCGRSTVLPGEVTDLPRGPDGWPQSPYDLRRLAADLVAVLDHLGVSEPVHVVGLSMGGMIAQHLAFGWPERVATLTSVMSTTGARDVGFTHAAARFVLTTPTPTHDEAAHLRYALTAARAIGTPGHVDDEVVAERARRRWRRGVHPQGTARQLLAIRADGDRTTRLAGVRAPTLVVHGTSDPLIDVSGGHATAAAIDGAVLVLVEGLGHDVPLRRLDELLAPLRAHLAPPET